jgi:hypothetical protein
VTVGVRPPRPPVLGGVSKSNNLLPVRGDSEVTSS